MRYLNFRAMSDSVIQEIKDELLRFVTPAGADECWPWHGEISSDGYGVFICEGKRFEAHRSAKMIFEKGWVYNHQDVIPMCGNKLCCNPSHLRVIDRVSV